jgi:hypothetical protein
MISKNIKTAIIIAVLIGTLLNIINSYDVILEGNFTTRNYIKMILTYITPFCVSLYSSTMASKKNTVTLR